MQIYESCFAVLKGVLKNGKSFSTASKEISLKATKENKASINGLAGLFLRNYYAIEVIAEKVFDTKELEPTIYIGLVFVNNSFKNFVDAKESLDFLYKKLGLYQIKVEKENKDEFAEAIKDRKIYVLKVLRNHGIRSLSARSNLPVWVIKMLYRQYDREMAQRTINEIVRMPRQYAILNKSILTDLSQLDNTKFIKIRDELYEFDDKTSIRKENLVRNASLMPLQAAEYELLERLPNLEGKQICSYFEDKSSFYVGLMNKYLPNNNLILMSNNPKGNIDLYSKIKSKNFEKLEVYEGQQSELVAHLSYKQDVFVYLPKSSNLELLRRSPEYGIQFNTDTLDEIIRHQNEGLNDVSQYVENGGILVYAVPTFDLKETMLIKTKFLEQHKDFALVIEKVYLPYENGNSIFYYAIFKKGKND